MLRDVKRYAVFVKEDAIRDMQVLSNYGEVVKNDYFDYEDKQDWNDFYGSVFMTTTIVDEDEKLLDKLKGLAADFNVSPESLEFIEIGVKERFKTYDDLLEIERDKKIKASIKSSQMYNLGVILGNCSYYEDDICESVSIILDSLDENYTNPDFIEGYADCHPENPRSKKELLEEIEEKLDF